MTASPKMRRLDEVEDAVIVLPFWRRALSWGLKALVPLAILGGAAALYDHITATPPKAARAERERVARLVEVVAVAPETRGPLIEAWGEVVPAQSLIVQPEVAGRIVWRNPKLTVGGRIAAGEEILRLDDRQLRHAVRAAEAEVARIDALIAIEAGQAARAQSDLNRSPLNLTDAQRALVLREPQMAELRAQRAAAEAALDRAELDLAQAILVAPFDAIVTEEQASQGNMLSPTTPAATLIAADRAEVRLALPVGAIDWLDLGGGQIVRFTQPGVWPPGAWRAGRIERLRPSLTESGRMAEITAMVSDPLALEPANAGEPTLLMGSFLRAEIEGRAIEGAVLLDRGWLRDGGTVWVMTDRNTLEIRPVEVAWRGADAALISGGLLPDERVVVTPLASVADGMALRLAPEATAAAGGGGDP